MSSGEVKKPIPSMTKGEMNPPTVHMAMPKEMAFDRIGVGKSSAAIHWLKIYEFHFVVILFFLNIRPNIKYQPIPIK